MKHRGEILNLKEEDFFDSNGKIKFPVITYKEFIQDWLPKDIVNEKERQYWYKKEMRKAEKLYERFFPNFEIPKGENASLIEQGIKPLEEHGRPIK